MEQSIISQYLGWAAWILLLIPLVLLVRLFSRRSRWSILRMVLVSLSGLAVVSAWLHFSETTVGAAEGSLGGKLGIYFAGKLTEWTGHQVGPAFAISTVLLFLWAAFALMDAVIATQFHPEYKSTPECPHPLFVSFIRAALDSIGK